MSGLGLQMRARVELAGRAAFGQKQPVGLLS